MLPGEARGPVWPQGGPGLEKGTIPPRKRNPFLAPKWRSGSTFRRLFLVFFEVFALQIFYDFGCPRIAFWLPFWLYFESSGWAFGKTAESVVKVVNFRGLAPARLSLFTGSDCGCVSVTFFGSFF